MQNKTMPKQKSMGPRPLLGVPSPALFLAEGEAQIKAKAPRLRAQQRGRVAKGKKGRFRAELRHLWGKTRLSRRDRGGKGCVHAVRPYRTCAVCGTASARGSERKGESRDALRPLSPKEKVR